MLTTRPHLRARMPGTNAAVTRKVPSRLMESTLRQSAKVMVAKSCCGKIPAQFTTMSTWPNLACTCLLIAATESSLDTSQTTASALRPAASTSFTVSRPSAISATATSTPSSARRLAKACPMPLAAPVITATLSLCPFPTKHPLELPVHHPEAIYRGFLSERSPDRPTGPPCAGLLRGACHRAGHFGPDPLARNGATRVAFL